MSEPLPQHSAPILVTGAHRTGTTWVGKILSASGEAAYISEPLNVLHRPGVNRVTIRYWYTYICMQNQSAYLSAFQEVVRLRYHLLAELGSLRSIKDALRMVRDSSTFWLGKLRGKRPLIKDPFAVFSAPWFAESLGCQVVVTVRHPAAFASSLKRLNWAFDFRDLLSQPLLMQHYLGPFREDMEKAIKDPPDIIEQASLLWRVIYTVVKHYCQAFPNFQVVRHEDLSLNPLQGYQNLYSSLGLTFTPKVERVISKTSSAENPKELGPRSTYSVVLNSRANLDNWKRRLNQDEIEQVRRSTADIVSFYYPETEWG